MSIQYFYNNRRYIIIKRMSLDFYRLVRILINITLKIRHLSAVRCIEREDKQWHGSYVTEREKMSLCGTRTTHILLSGKIS
jgi:hypothetical protein